MVTDESVTVAEHECEADGIEQNAAKAGIHDAFHQNVDGLARTAEARFQHGEADLHAEHEECRHEGPRCVHRIHDVGSFDLRRRRGLGIDVTEENARYYGHEEQDNPHSHDLSSEQRPTIPAPLRLSKPVA